MGREIKEFVFDEDGCTVEIRSAGDSVTFVATRRSDDARVTMTLSPEFADEIASALTSCALHSQGEKT